MSAKKSVSRNGWLKVLICLAVPMGLGGCVDYLKHRDTITAEAGEAQDWNKVVHITDPWPPYVMNTSIPGDGQRTAKVIQRYSTGGQGAGPGQEPAPADSATGVVGD